MTNQQLTILQNSLDESNLKDKILINKMGYYIYYNEPNKKSKEVKIHIHNCGFCAWGSGRDTTKETEHGLALSPNRNKLKNLQEIL